MSDHPPLRTLTHARLRAAQGDLAGARRLAEEIARSGGADAEPARRFIASLGEPRGQDGRVARLSTWLDRFQRMRTGRAQH